MQGGEAAAARASALWLLVPGLGLISHTYAPFPPVMLFFLAALPLAWYGLDAHLHGGAAGGAAAVSPSADARAWRPFLWVAVAYTGYMLVLQYILGTSLRSTWGVVCAACYGLLPLLLWSNGPETAASLFTRHRPKFDWAFRIALVVYTIEALWRYGLVWLSSEASVYQGIYRYKFGGLMYSESNATGIHILIWLFFTLWWVRALHRRGLLPDCRSRLPYIGMGVWWLVLLGLTLSRACWLAAGIGLLYFCMPVSKLRYIWSGLSVCLAVAAAGFALFIYPRVQYDASFISKFQIWYAFLDYWQQASWADKLFGIGLTRSEIAMGVYAHSYVLVFLVETGLLGSLLMLALFGRMLLDSRGEGLYLLLPFAIATLSTTVLFIPELFLFLSFMMAVRQSEKPVLRT
ncbi:MAG: hypothetical protein K2O53_01200 [Bacteroidales bacterium]|nr:hypothetical protein [Bacteroidales bacterium]